MSTTIIRPKTREEWLQHRAQGIGSSEVATILGLNPWETPYQLWRRKRGLDQPKPENEAMLMGHLLEDAIAQRWQMATGRHIIKRSAIDWIIVDDQRPWLRVSPDRTYWVDPDGRQNEQNKGVLECKSTMLTVDPDDLPPYWFSQVQYQLGVGGYRCGEIGWLTLSTRTFGHKSLDFDKDYFEWEVAEVTDFWRNCVEGDKEPPCVTPADVLLRDPKHKPGMAVEADDDIVARCHELKDIKGQMSELKTRKEGIEDALKVYIGEAEGIVMPGEAGAAKPKWLATFKAPKPGRRFNERRFEAEHGELHEQYMEESQGPRRLLVK